MRRARTCAVMALLIVAGCGGGGGGNHGNLGNDQATPIATVTPTPLATASVVSLAFHLQATADLAAASFTIGYEAGRGSFSGSGAQAQCHLDSNDILAVNDDDAGTLRVALVPANPLQRAALALPTTLTCNFDTTGGSIGAGDVRIVNKKVGVLDAGGVVVAGDASRLDVR